MSRVTKIEQISIAPILLQKTSIKRVAAYARVSTYNDEQLNSLEAQKDYYEKKIEENPSWVLAGIYVDEGITGTSYLHRAEFQRMIEDCKQGNHGYEKTFFAGLVKCGKCGYACNHVLYHRQPADKAYIECNKRKTKECDLLPIREVELKTIMEQVAGRRENVERIILFDGHIDFLMKDGTVKSHIREFTPLGRKATPFSGKISCGYCGSSIVRCGSSNRRKCWMCSIKKTDKDGCEHELMSDGELYGAAQSILGTEENLDMEIYLHIEKTISYNDRIEFYMKEGGKKVWQRR